MPSRRTVLKSIAPLAIAAIAPKPTEIDECDYHAQCLARAMREKHGGNWVVKIDHEHPSFMGLRL